MTQPATYSNVNQLSMIHHALLYFSQCKTQCAQAIATNIERSLRYMDELRAVGLKHAEKDTDGTPKKYLLDAKKDGTLELKPYSGKNPRNLPLSLSIIEGEEYHADMAAIDASINFEKFLPLYASELCVEAVQAAHLIPLRNAGILREQETTVHNNGVSQSVH